MKITDIWNVNFRFWDKIGKENILTITQDEFWKVSADAQKIYRNINMYELLLLCLIFFLHIAKKC